MEYLIILLAMAISLVISMAVLGVVATEIITLAQCIRLRRRVLPALRALFTKAVDIERLGYQIATCASEHNKDRAAFFAAIHALPHYAQLHAIPVPATTDQEKQLRLLVLNIQMHLRQTLRRLQARQATRISRSERKHLRNEAARLSAISKPLLMPLYDRIHPLSAPKNLKK